MNGSGWIIAVQLAMVGPLIGALAVHHARERRVMAELRDANVRIAELATVAERERIARDIHDALGHSLTLLVLKAQVVRRRAEQARLVASPAVTHGTFEAPAPALSDEVRELEDVARRALSEVRRAVRGYRVLLDDTVASARTLLESAGVALEVRIALGAPAPERDTVLAMVLRELCTNVARHAQATHCTIDIREDNTNTTLTVSDNGVGGADLTGHGLQGVSARVCALGGSVRLLPTGAVTRAPRAVRGTTVHVTLPVRTA
jgi:two-component system sensor histidine kinase DesK